MDLDKNLSITKSILKSFIFVILFFLAAVYITNKAESSEDELKVKSEELREYVKQNGISYAVTREKFGKENLPVLYELLRDESYAPYWSVVAKTIGYISDDPNSIPVLLEYFQRDDSWNWESVNIAYSISKISGKMHSLALIGLIGGQQADKILRKAVTEEGAEQLASLWLKDELIPESSTYNSKDKTIERIQTSAILGLVYSEEPENIELLKKLYEAEEAKCRAYSEDNSLEKSSMKLHNSLVEAMGKLDYIEEHGLEKYLGFIGKNGSLDVIMSYMAKYCPVVDEIYKKVINSN